MVAVILLVSILESLCTETGPLLFLQYVNDIHKCSNKLRFYLFADDTNILYADKALETTINIELVNSQQINA